MRKIYSLVLMATMLLIGTNAWADGVIEIVRKGNTQPEATTYPNLQEAFAAAQDGDLLQLTGDINHTLTETDNSVWFGAPSSGTLDTYANPDLVNPQNGYRAVTLDLKGKTYTFNGNPRGTKEYICIALSRGKLTIQSTGGVGTITANTKGTDIIRMYGTYLKIDGKEETPFTHLVIEENVILNGEANAITIDRIRTNEMTYWNRTIYPFDYSCGFGGSNDPWKWYGVANGVRLDVKGTLEGKKYALKPSGAIRLGTEYYAYFGNQDVHVTKYEEVTPNTNPKTYYLPRGAKISEDANAPYGGYEGEYVYTDHDAPFAPYIHIHSSAVLKGLDHTSTSSVGFYSGGYCRAYIEGHVEGSTGVYVKSGDVELHDATIESVYDGAYVSANEGLTSGVKAGGSAIVIESNAEYTGSIDATVSGDTKATGSSGYAIDEAVTTAEGTAVDAITITGGTFVGGGEGTIKLSETTVDATSDPEDPTIITIEGGAVANGQTTITVGDEEVPLTDFLADTDNTNTHITYVTDENNNTTMIISEGPAPAEDPDNVGNTTWAFIASQSNSANPPSYAWTAVEQNQQISSGTIYLGELQINSGSAGNLQELTIKNGATLQVERLLMNAYARIIVEAGGKLVVKGTQGISAPSVENIKLEASENAQAIFLFHPAVASNRHPNAKVEYHSNSFYSDHNVQQFFGVPTYNGAVSNIETESTAAIYFDVWRNPGWDYIGAMNVPVTPSDPSVLANLDKFDLPFGLYCITSKNDADHKPVFTFSGKLTGNIDHNFTLHQGWTSMANAYTGPIDKNAIVAKLAAWNASYGTEQSVYTYDLNESTGAIQWHARSKYALPTNGINAMQPIMFHNGSDVEGVVLDYSDLVWDPFVAANPSAAPARQAISNITKAQINIAGENEADYTTIVADSELGDDRSFCAPKYNNAGLQLYVMGNEKYDVYAADEIESSYIGYRTVNAGLYTISFENVQGEDLVLVDLVNGARTNMTEGAIYTFHAEANETNDYRFQVVAAAKMPTSIENTEAQSTKKAGVY
ncbi:MAG: hypothetical protein J5621_04080, partial [Paludibacteraceae bacterium]|nr:hypothetical protein [Paludibacteraceae bacterium]